MVGGVGWGKNVVGGWDGGWVGWGNMLHSNVPPFLCSAHPQLW